MTQDKKPKATITLSEDEDGRPCAVIVFDPPLPPRPDGESEEAENAWLEQIPTIQLSGFIVMDDIMDMFGEDVELESLTVKDFGNGSLH